MFFLVMLAVHFSYSLIAAWRTRSGDGKKPDMLLLITQTPIFLLGIALAWQEGAFSRELLSPLYIALGLIGGHVIFGLSVLATYRSWRAALEMLGQLGPLWRFIVDSPMVLMRVITASVAEEVIYRAAAQPLFTRLTGSAIAGVLIVAVVFSLVHSHFFRNAPIVSVEFVAFSMALGLLYYLTANLTLVAVIHAVRNTEIHFLEDTLERENGTAPQSTADAFEHTARECP
jgi:membrane protease YdiL (CAAX protease family)